jgi:hypothetical protein
VNILVSLDTKKSRIVIYSEVIQLFEIIQYQATEENDTDVVYLACKDNNGDDCTSSMGNSRIIESNCTLITGIGLYLQYF